jgi:hypothetical protein
MSKYVDNCANCDAELTEGKRLVYDEHSERHFCDNQCFREWASDKGAETVIAFYKSLNVNGVEY